ncbi:IS982 family transposase, partial [Colwellia hornerae]
LNVISGIVAYCLKKKKPRIKLSASEFGLMEV